MVTSKSPKKMEVAFGSKIPRFGARYIHPNLDRSGLFVTRPKGCNPCLYRPQSMADAYEKVNLRNKKDNIDPWKYKTNLEDWCKNLGYRNQKVLEQRRWFATLLGPAWTEVSEPVQYEPACKNLSFGRVPRFRPSRNYIPGPGTYYKEVPYKAPYGPHSTRPTLEREEPCRFKDLTKRWSLAPDRYKIPDHDSIENKSKKVVSIRGPYDLFTGKRDVSSIKNHFSTSPVVAKTWPLSLPGSLEGLKTKHTGEWNKTGRDIPPKNRTAINCLAAYPRKSSEPSPASYKVYKPLEFPQYKYGFNSSYDRPPGYIKTIVWPGVGRYTMRGRKPCGVPEKGHRHVFISKVGRTIGAVIQEPMNSF